MAHLVERCLQRALLVLARVGGPLRLRRQVPRPAKHPPHPKSPPRRTEMHTHNTSPQISRGSGPWQA